MDRKRLAFASVSLLLVSAVLALLLPRESFIWGMIAVFCGYMLALGLHFSAVASDGEAKRRARAADAVVSAKDPDRTWFYVGWDDHLMFAERRNRPTLVDDRAKALYEAGFAARLDWSTAFTR